MTLHCPQCVERLKRMLERKPWLGYYIAVIVTAEFVMHLIETHSF